MKRYISNSEHMENMVQKLIQKNPIKDNSIFLNLSGDCLKELSTHDVIVLAARLEDDKNYKSRDLHGYAKLNNFIVVENDDFHVETQYIHFVFNIYHLDSILNCVSYISPFYVLTKEDIKNDIDDAVDAEILINNAVWGQDGIYKWMPTKSLTGDALIRRIFANNLQSVSRKYKWGQEARKIMKSK